MDSYFVFFIDSTQFSFLPFDFLSFVEGLKEDEDCDNFSNFNISFSIELFLAGSRGFLYLRLRWMDLFFSYSNEKSVVFFDPQPSCIADFTFFEVE